MAQDNINANDAAEFEIERAPTLKDATIARVTVIAEAFDRHGKLKFRDVVKNLIVNVGKDRRLDVVYGAQAKDSLFGGLIDGASPTLAPTDTMASKAWTENQNYTEATRPAYVVAAASGQSVTNAANKFSYSINTDAQVIGGCFMATSSTKGEVASVLYQEAAFSAAANLGNGDVLNVTYIVNE